jgi:ribosomal protein L37AE/L43A
MASVVLEGPFPLTADQVTTVITEKSPGSFVLGHLKADGEFTPRMVGRADRNLCQELELQVRFGKFNGFKFRYASTPKTAFEHECCDFHDCGECEALDNKYHPVRPSHTDWECPVCGSKFLKSS